MTAKNLTLKLRRVKAILFDVDGVLTDGRIILGPGDFEAKFFDAKDGHRIRLAGRGGLEIYFVTGRRSKAVARRGKELGIAGVLQGIVDKTKAVSDISKATGISVGELAYMGDDLVDLPAMRMVGVCACPSDAAPEVAAQAAMIVPKPGGRGAAGQFIEAVLKAQDKWGRLMERYSSP